jgi:hypothetical protein
VKYKLLVTATDSRDYTIVWNHIVEFRKNDLDASAFIMLQNLTFIKTEEGATLATRSIVTVEVFEIEQ